MKSLIYWGISLPILLFAKILKVLNYDNLNDDLEKCKKYIGDNKVNNIPDTFVIYLVAAEDHRFYFHHGIDQIAILRAIYVKKLKNKYQGASTIEQQFVRVITGRYEKTKQRKFREQLLALLLDGVIRDKNSIAKTYLEVAFYGSGLEGIQQFIKRKKCTLSGLSVDDSVELIARLKYPEPLIAPESWKVKIQSRKEYTLKRQQRYLLK